MTDAERIARLEEEVEHLKEAVVKLALADYKVLVAVANWHNHAGAAPPIKELFQLHDDVAALVGGKNLARE